MTYQHIPGSTCWRCSFWRLISACSAGNGGWLDWSYEQKRGRGWGITYFAMWLAWFDYCNIIVLYIYILYDGMMKSTGHIPYIPLDSIIYIGKAIRIWFDIVFIVLLMEESCKSLPIARINLLIGWCRIFFLQPVSTGLMGVVHQCFGMKLIKLIIHQSPIYKVNPQNLRSFSYGNLENGAPTYEI